MPFSMQYEKWGGSEHWHFDVEALGEDEHGSWYTGRPGIVLQRGREEPMVEQDGFAMLVPKTGDWIAFWNRLDDPAVYVDVTDTPRRTADRILAVDLDLDVVRWRDGRVEIIDEDEFDDHRIELGYPDEVVAGARATADWLRHHVGKGLAPFDGSGPSWLARAIASWSTTP